MHYGRWIMRPPAVRLHFRLSRLAFLRKNGMWAMSERPFMRCGPRWFTHIGPFPFISCLLVMWCFHALRLSFLRSRAVGLLCVFHAIVFLRVQVLYFRVPRWKVPSSPDPPDELRRAAGRLFGCCGLLLFSPAVLRILPGVMCRNSSGRGP